MTEMRCPLCGRTFAPDGSDALPFCSRRCRQIDLARWLDERYRVPYERTAESDDEPEEPGG